MKQTDEYEKYIIQFFISMQLKFITVNIIIIIDQIENENDSVSQFVYLLLNCNNINFFF